MMWRLSARVCLVVAAACGVGRAQDQLQVLAAPPQTADAQVNPQEMLHAYLMGQVAEAAKRRSAEYEKVKTPEQAAAYQARMREFFWKQLGPLPERTPLNAQVTGQEKREGYRIEKVLFESQPHHHVTGNLYIPEGAGAGPFPAVLVPCGHSTNGKAAASYQRASIQLAKAGLIAFCYDPIDQGERHQMLKEDGTPESTSSQSTAGHSLTGLGATLLGRNTATYRLWDGMRAIDYLCERPDVDPMRIGCTGISGGGTATSQLMALDDRIQVAAPGCYLTSLPRLLETIGPQDAEQNIAGQLGFGFDHAEYVLMRAPKPTLMMVATKDFFDITGAWDNFRQVKRWYSRLGYFDAADLIEVDSDHGFQPEMRVAAARWMRRWFLGSLESVREPVDFPIEPDETLRCSPAGEVMRMEDERSVYDLNRELEASLASKREQFWREKGREEGLKAVRKLTGIKDLAALPETTCENLGIIQRDGYRVEKVILTTEPGITLPALAFVPENPSGKKCLYVHGEGKAADAQAGGAIEAMVKEGMMVLVPDLRGIGETKPAGKHSYSRYLTPEWRECTIAYLLGKSLLAMQAEDVLVCARYLATYGEDGASRPVRLVSVASAGPAALHALALEPGLFEAAQIRKGLRSWSDVVRSRPTMDHYASVIHGALQLYDLPDLARSLPEGKLELVDEVKPGEE